MANWLASALRSAAIAEHGGSSTRYDDINFVSLSRAATNKSVIYHDLELLGFFIGFLIVEIVTLLWW